MMATRKKILAHEPNEMEMLLPWHAAGTLDARQARRVEKALARDAGLARQYDVIQQEQAETVIFNESLGVPSVRAMHRLFAAIDAEPAGRSPAARRRSARFAGLLASLSPRMAWVVGLGALVMLIEAGIIAVLLVK
jgi:anti-sigma factor RsiW